MIRSNHNDLLGLFPQQESIKKFRFEGVSIDSRNVVAGNLFIAIVGEQFDGHNYVKQAVEKGAVAVITHKTVDVSVPQIRVSDTRNALGQLARWWRHQCPAKVVAITGSNGKTTVKEMLGTIVNSKAPALVTEGNLNNDIGVPLTLFKLDSSHRYAVIEMGANHAGEIEYLVSIADPDVVYVNNAMQAHVEGFGSLQGVRDAKGEMYRNCHDRAIAVFNADETAFKQWFDSCPCTDRYCFSMSTDNEQAGINLAGVSIAFGHGQQLTLVERFNDQVSTAECQLGVIGKHNAMNALAALSLARVCGIELTQACEALRAFTGVSGRQQFLQGPANSRIIDDSYNANPDSLASAIDVLCGLEGEAWLALGDMAELGDEAQALHDHAIQYAHQSGVKQLFALGPLSCDALLNQDVSGHCFNQHDDMVDFIKPKLNANINLLVKGSRSARMDRIVSALTADITQSDPAVSMAGVQHAV